MKLTRNQLIVNALCCSVLLGVVIWELYAEYDKPWKMYQQQFRQLNSDRSTAGNPTGIRQIWNQELGAANRCVTCHEGINNPLLISARQPFKTHSGNYLKHHPVEKFGCVICHEGQGPALTAEAAHGEAANWTKPVLRGVFAQSSCMKCHDAEQLLSAGAGADSASTLINGWRLFQQYNCTGCHRFSEVKKPDRIGPALTLIGNKVNRDWLVNWLKDPGAYRPGTKMPRFTLKEEDTVYIADYLLSLNTGRGTARRAPANAGAISDGKNLVNTLGCTGCHKINDKGNDFGPDFSDIGNKVNHGWLIGFLKNPRAYDSKTIIPDFQIEEDDIGKIAVAQLGLI